MPELPVQIARADIVEIHGEHESGEGVMRWGYALYDPHACEVLPGPLYLSYDEAQQVIDTTREDGTVTDRGKT